MVVALPLLPVAAAGNLLPNAGFENWDAAANLPTKDAWRWGFQKGKEKDFAAFEQSTAEKFSGASSLHVKDGDSSGCNNTVSYAFSNDELAKLRGHTLYFAGRVKQVAASGAGVVGLAISVQLANGRWDGRSIGTGTRGATDWRQLRVSYAIPADARIVRVVLNCANGYYNTGDAYFDELVATVDPCELPKLELTSPDALGHADWTLPPATNDASDLAVLRASYRNQPPQAEDGRVRPEIRNGTWYVNGRPEYYLGVWLYNHTDLDWGKNPDILKTGHPAYLNPPSKELFAQMGFNSSQVSAAYAHPGAAQRGLPLPDKDRPWHKDWRDQERLSSEFYPRFGDMPMVIDFAFGYNKAYPADGQRILDQYNDKWHAFIPFCPEHPEGDRYYRDWFTGGARNALRHGCNIFLYELFNESSYNCQCPWNIRRFTKEMVAKYRTIDRANAAWGTAFADFDEVALQSSFARFPGVWYDWCVFSGRRYAEILTRCRKEIERVDRRSRIYFTEQAAGTPGEHPGMDYRKIADALDVLAIEGGWRYGFKTAYNAKNEMEAVVATSGSKHFFNCDFYQALAKGKKPIVNDEHYCTRLENGKRVPSKRTDFITSLWLEVMHGVSANFTYVWDKRQWDWKTFEEAKANAIKPSYKSSSLLNPYNMPPSELCAFKQFQDELAPFKEKLLPFPRTLPATVAVYYSQPTMIQRDNLEKKKGDDSTISRWYVKLLHAQLPVRVVFDEDIYGLDPEVKALVFPGTQCVAEETLQAAKAFQKRGGLVIADTAAFAYDEYLKPRVAETDFLRAADGDAAVRLLLEKGVDRYATLEPSDDSAKPLTAADVQICDRGDFKLVVIANMDDPQTRRVRLHLNLKGPRTPFYLYDAIGKKLVTSGRTKFLRAVKTWTPEDLAAGVELVLPPQERVVLTLTKSLPEGEKE